MTTVAVIPTRLVSKRFPNKLFSKFMGETVLDHSIKNTLKFDFVDSIVVATDSIEISKYVKNKYPEVEVYMIDDACCGTHRVYEFYEIYPNYNWYVSIPCDEPAIDPNEINKTIKKIDLNKKQIITFYTKFFCKEDLFSPLSCKIVSCENDYMIYNSRAVIPVLKDGSFLPLEQYKKHVGIFIFPFYIFQKYQGELWTSSTDIESLEQNRFLQHNVKIKMYETKHIGFGIDLPEQIEILEKRIKEFGNG